MDEEKKVKQDELINDKSVEDPTTSSYGTEEENYDGSTAYWLPIGLAIGVAIGAATDNLALWMSIGVAFGVLLMGATAKKSKK